MSIHTNAFNNPAAKGLETWYNSVNSISQNFAKKINNNLSKLFRDRGVKPDKDNRHGRLGILRDVNIDATALVELGFITNEKDLQKILNPDTRNEIVNNIKNTILNHLNIKEVPLIPNTPNMDELKMLTDIMKKEIPAEDRVLTSHNTVERVLGEIIAHRKMKLMLKKIKNLL